MLPPTFKYRREIDGLRAVAVLSVILFHAEIPGFLGGFVGVDVFFVISGYLITGILLRELSSGEFSIGKFYERRVRRIFPALFVVMMACIPLGWFLMDPYAYSRLGQGLMGVTLFVSNILFWRTTNYFTATVDNPLLHTWSLGVEEQFYIFFPFVLWLIWRHARRWLLLAICLTAVASLGISQWGVQTGRAVAAFYLSPSRAFEMLLGSLVAIAAFRNRIPKFGRGSTEFLAWFGMAAIIWATVIFDSATLFPGWHALIPSAGTAVILAFMRPEGALGRLLSLRAMVGMGLISYSAYLWHQPVFAFAHIAGWRPDVVGKLALILTSLIFAGLSWRLIEHPFRNRAFLSSREVFGWAALASTVMLGVGGALYVTQGVSSRFTEEERRWWHYADIGYQSGYVVERFNRLSREFEPGSTRRILIVGDSFAQDFANVVHESGRWREAQIRTAYVPAVCQMVNVAHDISRYIAAVDRPVCKNSRTLRSSMPLIRQADIVILASSWKRWSAQLLPDTIMNLGLRPDQQLFVIGSKSFGEVSIRDLLSMREAGRVAARHQISSTVSEINTILKNGLSPEVFIDQIYAVCGFDGSCPLVTGQDRLISYDGGHLTKDGAKYIAERLFEKSALARIR